MGEKKVWPEMVAPGKELKRLREERGLSLRPAAEQAGVGTEQQLSQLETGRVQNPSMKTLVGYGKLYGKTPNEMAEMYGYWTREEEQQQGDGYLKVLRTLTSALPPDRRERALRQYIDDAALELARLVQK